MKYSKQILQNEHTQVTYGFALGMELTDIGTFGFNLGIDRHR